jgi:ribosomal protein S12 methylthiotransferase accessory factor YcaO
MREKYVEIVRGFYKRERKASEDFMKVKIGEEELAHERLVEERKDLSKLLTAIEERVASSGKVQTALLSLYAELQGLSLS